MTNTARKGDRVTLTRARYEALLARIEEAEDRAALAAQRAREEALGVAEARKDYLPIGLVERLVAGESPVRIWREHRGLSLRALAEKAGVKPGYLSEIETGKKPGSLDAMRRLARALEISLDHLTTAEEPPAKRRGRA